MKDIFRKHGYVIFGILFIVSVLLLFGDFFTSKNGKKVENELFKSELIYLNSIDKVVSHADSLYKLTNIIGFDTAKYVQIVSETIKQRFSYGLLHYKFSENWIAALSGKLFWSHLSAVVDSDDILKHSEGLCSQQTIVFMEVLKRRGINVRSVGLGEVKGPGHFLCEVHYENSWRLHDVTKEPQWSKIVNHHESMEYYLANKDSLYAVYENRIKRKEFDKIMKKVVYGKVNEFPAKKMALLHQITLLITYILPLFFLFMFISSLVNIYRVKKQGTGISEQN